MWKSNILVCVTFSYNKDDLGHHGYLWEIPKTWEHFVPSLCIPSFASLSSGWSHSLFSAPLPSLLLLHTPLVQSMTNACPRIPATLMWNTPHSYPPPPSTSWFVRFLCPLSWLGKYANQKHILVSEPSVLEEPFRRLRCVNFSCMNRIA